MAFGLNFRKKQTAVKGRSSALLVSVVVHVILFLIAGTFVAVQVAKYSEPKFEGKQIVRPKMKLKKLQVPVKIEKQVRKQAPKLNQRVTASPRVSTKAVDFKMPEVGGFGGGPVANFSGMGLGGGSLGFATTQLNVFGLKSSGEKIVFILDTNRNMLIDEIGGIPAYKIIKDELINLISGLPPTALFNVIVFDQNAARAFSAELSPASDSNIQQLKQWLGPLNSSKSRFGLSTLASPGTSLEFEPAIPICNIQRGWPAAVSYAIKKGADNIYWLGADDYMRRIHKDLYADCKRGKPISDPSGMPPEFRGTDFDAYGGKEKWDKLVDDARKKFEAENEDRRKKGMPLRVIPSHGGTPALVRMYYPGAAIPQRKDVAVAYEYTDIDVLEYIEALSQKYSQQDRRSTAIGLKKKKLSFNVVHFVPLESETAIPQLRRLRTLPQKLNGDYIQIQGMEAIQSAATAGK